MDDERTGYCPRCGKETRQYRFPSGRWYCHECGWLVSLCLAISVTH